MKKRPEIFVRINRYSPAMGCCSTTHRLTTPLGLSRVLNRLSSQALDQRISLTTQHREDAVALGLREFTSGEWVTASMEPILVEIEDECAQDLPGFLDLLFGNRRAGDERKHRRK